MSQPLIDRESWHQQAGAGATSDAREGDGHVAGIVQMEPVEAATVAVSPVGIGGISPAKLGAHGVGASKRIRSGAGRIERAEVSAPVADMRVRRQATGEQQCAG